MFQKLVIRGVTFQPAVFLAPLAGLTHRPFRRLVADFGGCGGYFTEMLSAKQILREDIHSSPHLLRSAGEERLVYQLMVRSTERLDEVVGRLEELRPDGIDINLACHAPVIRNLSAGSGLFENVAMLKPVLETLRNCWPGPLTVKIRLGRETSDWRSIFADRMRLFEDCGVDAVILHPRFLEDKFVRRARHELYAWAASLSRLPVIANGDIMGAETIRGRADDFSSVSGVMIGRMAVAQPWIFQTLGGRVEADVVEVWHRLCDYVCEDFVPEKQLPHIKLFTRYYSRNFVFGHSFRTAITNSGTVEEARERACEFFAAAPGLHAEPPLMGV